MQQSIIRNWEPEFASRYGSEFLLLQHRLHESELFSKETLADLIDRYPREHYGLNTMGYDPENPVWREGTITGCSGADVIQAIEQGRMWLNLRCVEKVDPRYARLLDDIFAEFEGRVPGLSTFKRKLGILISSPKVQVFYHCDIPGQSLWQIRGGKRVYIYPNEEPFLPQKDLETVVLGETEEEIPYDRHFDEAAEVLDLEPGQMVHWPLNCPHRVENKDELSISLTTEHWTSDIRKSYAVNFANGVLRKNFGVSNLSQSIRGPFVYPKAALTAAWRMLKLNQAKKFVPAIDFTIDLESKTKIADLPIPGEPAQPAGLWGSWHPLRNKSAGAPETLYTS